jgi:hypothetical protein
MMKIAFATVLMASAGAAMGGAQIAGTDFDGNDLNLLGSSVSNLDGGPGDYFGLGSLGAWPQGTGVPFSLTDDSVFSVSSQGANAPFAADNEGIFGQNASTTNTFFALSDSDEFGTDQTASWDFSVAGAPALQLAIDFAGIASDSFGGFDTANTFLRFEYSIDGGAFQTAFEITAVDNTGQFTTRLMDAGNASGGGSLLVVNGPNGVTKFDASTGLAVADTFADKATVDTGALDTFLTDLTGTGSTLTLRFTANVPFEAAAFDNIAIFAVPTPASAMLLGLGGLAATRRRRA